MRTFFMGVRAIRLLILAIVVISGIISYFQKKHTEEKMQQGQIQELRQAPGVGAVDGAASPAPASAN